MSFSLAVYVAFVRIMPVLWCLLCERLVFQRGWWRVIKVVRSIKQDSLSKCASLMPMLGLSIGSEDRAGAVLIQRSRLHLNVLSAACKRLCKMSLNCFRAISSRRCAISILLGSINCA